MSPPRAASPAPRIAAACAVIAASLGSAACNGHPKPETWDLHFESSSGALPADAVVGGVVRGLPGHVCRAGLYFEGKLPGMLLGDRCEVSWAGQQVLLENFEVLRTGGTPYYWRLAKGDPRVDLPDAFVGGEDVGNPMAVCMASHNGEMHVGRVAARDGRSCLFGYGLEACTTWKFYVLVNQPNPFAGASEGPACAEGTPVRCPLASGCCPLGVAPSCVAGLPDHRCAFPDDCH